MAVARELDQPTPLHRWRVVVACLEAAEADQAVVTRQRRLKQPLPQGVALAYLRLVAEALREHLEQLQPLALLELMEMVIAAALAVEVVVQLSQRPRLGSLEVLEEGAVVAVVAVDAV